MRSIKPNGSAEIAESLEVEIGSNLHELKRQGAAFRQQEHGDAQVSGIDLGMLLSRVAEGLTREIESLIDELHGLRVKLEPDGSRIQGDIVRHEVLSQE